MAEHTIGQEATMDEIAWQLEHSVGCDASPEFAWSYPTQVATLSFEWRFDAPGSGVAADECGIRRWLLASEGAGRAARVTV